MTRAQCSCSYRGSEQIQGEAWDIEDVNWRRQRTGIHCQVYCSFPKRIQKADTNVELTRSPDGDGEGTL